MSVNRSPSGDRCDLCHRVRPREPVTVRRRMRDDRISYERMAAVTSDAVRGTSGRLAAMGWIPPGEG
jgi:hypothetical protein